MKFSIEDINDPVLREIYTQEHDDAIKGAAQEIAIEIQEQFHIHQNEIFQTFSKLNCEIGKSYVDQEMTYNLITNFLEVLLSDCDQIGKEALRDMLDSDIAEMIYGPPSEEELAQAAKNDEEAGQKSMKRDVIAWMEKEIDGLISHLAECMDTEDTKNTVVSTTDMESKKHPGFIFNLEISIRRKEEEDNATKTI